jgi:mxaJ protein
MTRARRHGCMLAVALTVVAASGTTADSAVLRVCTDPNNLPFSNSAGAGFEDALAALVASELGWKVEHYYWAQRRGFVRNTLKEGKCDVVMGVPSALDSVETTRPYYRSSYFFVARKELAPPIRSLDDARLRQLKIGVPLIGDDYANPPPVHALSRRGIVDNVQGFSVFGDYRTDSPPLALVRAVERGDVDVAVAWGPVAGFVSRHSARPLRLTQVSPGSDGPYPFTFAIAMGVKRGNTALKTLLDGVLTKNRKRIRELLDEHGVPQL